MGGHLGFILCTEGAGSWGYSGLGDGGGGREAPHANLSSTPSVDFDDLRGEKVKEGLNTV